MTIKTGIILIFSILLVYTTQSKAYVNTRVKTDRSVYESGQEITIYFTIKNYGPDTLHFNWPTSCQATYSIDDRPANLTCPQVQTSLTLYPDSAHTWIFKHKNGIIPLEPGTHIIKAEIINYEYYFAYTNFSIGKLKLISQEQQLSVEDTSYIDLSVVDDTLKFFWQTPEINTCLEPLWSGWLRADTFFVAMVDSGQPCDCYCSNHFHLQANFASFWPGDYILNFADGLYGYPVFHVFIGDIGKEEHGFKADNPFLDQNFPNPFNGATVFSFTLPQRDFVKLSLFDLSGRWIRDLYSGYEQKGRHKVIWRPGDDIASGFYFYQLRTSAQILSKKCLYVK